MKNFGGGILLRVAVIGFPNEIKIFNENVVKNSRGGGADFVEYVIQPPFISQIPNPIPNVEIIPLAKAMQLYRDKKIDAIAITFGNFFHDFRIKNQIKNLKLRGLDKILIFEEIRGTQISYWLNSQKYYIPYLETNLIDSCNLNCRGCMHFASFFHRDEIYPIEKFAHDLDRLSQNADVLRFRLLGGEPLLLKNLDEYLDIARKFFPQTLIAICTNGLLIPTLNDKIFAAIRRNSVVIDVTEYPPTTKIKSKIIETLNREGIKYSFEGPIRAFRLNMGDGTKIYNAEKARAACHSDYCRFLRDGKIYKCPTDGLMYRFIERASTKSYPQAMGVDLYSSDFSSMMDLLDQSVDLCYFCLDNEKLIPWQGGAESDPNIWIA